MISSVIFYFAIGALIMALMVDFNDVRSRKNFWLLVAGWPIFLTLFAFVAVILFFFYPSGR